MSSSISVISLKSALSRPITAALDAQHVVNLHTLDLIDKYNDNVNGFQFKNYKVKNENNTYDINVPVLNLVQIPSLTVSKFNVSMSLEDEIIHVDSNFYTSSSDSDSHCYHTDSNINVSLTNNKSIFKTYDINMEVSQQQEPVGLTKLNQLLYEFINIKQELIPKIEIESSDS